VCYIGVDMIQSIPVKISRNLLKKIQEILKDHPMYIDKDEFIRGAIRDKIEAIRAKPSKDEDDPEDPTESPLSLGPWIC